MGYLNNYLQQFRDAGKDELANSIEKTSRRIGKKYISHFTYTTHEMGLLFGNIQSGKTGQTFGIICEAADLEFRYFLLMTTDSKLLQKQTLERAQHDLPEFAICSENDEEKFRSAKNQPVLIIVKKNTRVLQAWVDRFRNSQKLKGNALFIVDDEADAASENTKVNQKKVSAINDRLRKIRDTAQASIYLQVTGTPQALLLQSLNSNWRPMFTEYFEPGNGYLGGDFFFPGTETNDIPNFIHFVDDETPQESAKHVVLRHLVVSAQILLTGGKVSNCLIHPGIRRAAHEKSKKEIEDAIAWWTYHHADAKFTDAFDREYAAIAPQNTEKQSHDQVLARVKRILEKREFTIVLLNGTSIDDDKDYESGCNFVIGGTNLGRGVTFGQLNTFYYTRTSKNPNADTMWQHNRMFGYDRDPGLITMYSSRALYKLFAEINETNNSIIRQAQAGKKITIAYPDGLNPTRSNVLDKSLLNILVGGSNHFPSVPRNETTTQISDLVQQFSNDDPATEVSLKFISDILKHFKAEKEFNLDGYIKMIDSTRSENPMASGHILVRRNRDVTLGNRALLSPNDWKETNQFQDEFVLTLYQVSGEKNNGRSVWVPNIKLPMKKNFYII
ncbi:Z1 domain-containing protein [Pediococcus pentosaceus]|uniref:Z1 domain-containing protein n=1 Tax=Pediococcus pentosaceus TaxID=1255 RepID=UPI00076265D9|nr:Z1 domain-containing protein [Pediococcus pentosaceus]NEZ70129.1 helicase [Pediococcus pentosaceus]